MGLKKLMLMLLILYITPSHTEDQKKKEYRLEESCIPLLYEIELSVLSDFDTSGKFSGSTKILCTATKEVSYIELHSHKLSFEQKNVNIMKTSFVNSIYNIQQLSFDKKLEKALITFDRPLSVGTNYSIFIEHFEGILDLNMEGFYRVQYKNSQGEFEWIAITQFETTYARRAFPCFDEPKYKAKFNIVINHPPTYQALSNTNIKNTWSFSDSKQTVFETTPTMSTYTVAFAVVKYASLSVSVSDGVKHVVWSSLNTIPFGHYALSISPKITAVMEKFTNIPYTVSNLSTVNHISVPDFQAGAMENWGLIAYRETAVLWNPYTSSARNKQRVGSVVAHELSHMWFGNLVTTEWWSSTWLNEGFARFFQYMALAEIETDWDLENQFIVEQHQSILILDALNKSKPLTNYEVYTPSEIKGMFDTITYSKGGCIVRMMSIFMGKEAFYEGISSYLSKYKFKSTVPSMLFNELDQNVNNLPETVPNIMSNWTEKSGFPLVTIRVSRNKLVLQQSQFGKENSTNSTKWFIPITYTTSKERNFDDASPKVWMHPDKQLVISDVLDDKTSWILFNIKSSAFIRINYDDLLLKGLQNALNLADHDNITPVHRAQIIDDLLNLARTKVISYNKALDVLFYLSKDLDYYPWYSAFSGFQYLIRRIEPETKLSQFLTAYIRNLMQNLYKNVTAYSSSSARISQIEQHKQVLTLSWACKLKVKDCIDTMNYLFSKFKKDNANINPNLRDVVYCTAVRFATNKDNWEYLWERLENGPSADEVPVLLSSLGCTSDEDILKKYLYESIKENSVIRRQDGQAAFRAVIHGSPKGIDLGLNFLINNFQNISARYGSLNALSSVITGMADRLTTKQQVDKLEEFINNNKEYLKDGITAAGTAIENARKNLEWVEDNERDLFDYLQAHEYSAARLNLPSLAVLTIFTIVNICILL